MSEKYEQAKSDGDEKALKIAEVQDRTEEDMQSKGKDKIGQTVTRAGWCGME